MFGILGFPELQDMLQEQLALDERERIVRLVARLREGFFERLQNAGRCQVQVKSKSNPSDPFRTVRVEYDHRMQPEVYVAGDTSRRTSSSDWRWPTMTRPRYILQIWFGI